MLIYHSLMSPMMLSLIIAADDVLRATLLAPFCLMMIIISLRHVYADYLIIDALMPLFFCFFITPF